MSETMQATTLDFSRLATPPGHGDTLVEPGAAELPRWAASNHAALAGLSCRILDVSGAEVRRTVRRALAVEDETLAIVTGHQPEFIHPGVWAKHVVVSRLAEAVSGAALNLVVDSDAPRDTALHVPSVQDGRLTVRRVSAAAVPAGFALELADCLSVDEVAAFAHALRAALGERFDRSLLPVYLDQLAASSVDADWGAQTTSARQAAEAALGVQVRDLRVSRVWGGVFLAELLVRARDFAAAYNRALADYRRRYQVRSTQRPIPDLSIESDRVEVPAWVYRRNTARRRLFVGGAGDRLGLFAEREPLGILDGARLRRAATAPDALAELADVCIRPRALTLTLWARLFLADLFVHGIGGAKYDRITDTLIHDYFGVAPPAMACVSATLRLDLPRTAVAADALPTARRRLRDVQFNPQRYVPADPATAELVQQRTRAIGDADALRAAHRERHAERRQAYQAIRACNARLIARHASVVTQLEHDLQTVDAQVQMNAVAYRRDYFFALFSRPALEKLLERLPARSEFAL